MEERIAGIESILEQMNETLDRIERGIVGVQTEVLRVRDRAEGLEDKIDANFRWTIGAAITMWVTIILAILFKGQEGEYSREGMDKVKPKKVGN